MYHKNTSQLPALKVGLQHRVSNCDVWLRRSATHKKGIQVMRTEMLDFGMQRIPLAQNEREQKGNPQR